MTEEENARDARIERLETATRRLLADAADLRQELQALRALVAPGTVPPVIGSLDAENDFPGSQPLPAQAPSHRPADAPSFLQRILDPPRDQVARPSPRASARAAASRPGILPVGMTFEDLVGRYGAMALAALAIMSGVGIFLSWAIAQNLIGPALRVGAGFGAAAALGALGWHLRHRKARTFGNTLMGIALAVVHVVAWGAGPGLQVMPNWLALGVAAIASIALALLAWRSGEESLFVVGVGGALIAPFVTTPGRGNGEALLLFGWLVLTTSLRGMRDRPWQGARWLLGAAGVAYAAAAMTAAWSAERAFSAEFPVVFAIACAWGALVLGGELHSSGLVRAYLIGAVGPLFYDWDAEGIFVPHLIMAGVATMTLFVSVLRSPPGDEGWVMMTMALPIAFLIAALAPLDDAFSPTGALVALGWTGGAAVAGGATEGRRRDVLWSTGVLAAMAAIILQLSVNEIAMVAALSALAAAASFLARREGGGLLLGVAVPVLVVAAIVLGIQFDLRPPYGYTPFLTSVSVGALALVVAIGVYGWNALRIPWAEGLTPRARGLLNGLGIIAAFVWGHVELVEAYSPDLAVFLLIIYYAACGVAAIFIGRRSGLTDVRRVGLALAIFAALKAVAQGYELKTVGLRVGSFLLVGAFLLAVAYWYRAAGDAEPVADAADAH